MFRAVDKNSDDSFIIIEDSIDIGSIREACKAKRLICPFCKHPLIAKVGEIRQAHFAHVKGSDSKCPFKSRDKDREYIRAILFKFFQSRLNTAKVDTEYIIKGIYGNHIIDCIVQMGRKKVGYVILKNRVNNAGYLKQDLDDTDFFEINYLFIFNERYEPQNEFLVKLSAAHEKFLDEGCKVDAYNSKGDTLHFFNIDNESIITYRGLKRWNNRLYSFDKMFTSKISDISILPDYFSFIHKDEYRVKLDSSGKKKMVYRNWGVDNSQRKYFNSTISTSTNSKMSYWEKLYLKGKAFQEEKSRKKEQHDIITEEEKILDNDDKNTIGECSENENFTQDKLL